MGRGIGRPASCAAAWTGMVLPAVGSTALCPSSEPVVNAHAPLDKLSPLRAPKGGSHRRCHATESLIHQAHDGYAPQRCIRQATCQPCYYNLRTENMEDQVDV